MNSLYINKSYNNLVTMNGTMDDLISNSKKITWNEFFEEIYNDEQKMFEEMTGKEINDPNDYIDNETIEAYETDILFYIDNYCSPEVDAYYFIKELDLLPLDKNGTGSLNGVHLVQTLANGPRKEVYIDDENAAKWLITECKKRNIELEVIF